jgi:diguanylate cyclase (GGDEF)-like protein
VPLEHLSLRHWPTARAVVDALPASDASRLTVADPRAILRAIGEVVYTWHVGPDVIAWGANVTDVLPNGAEAITTGARFAQLIAPDSATSRYDAVMHASDKDDGRGVRFQVEYGLIFSPAAAPIWVEDTGRWFAGSDGRPQLVHGVLRALNPRSESGPRPRESVLDPLTGALSRASFIARLRELTADFARLRQPFAILLAGIDNLAILNRSYGYQVADEVIAAVVQRVRGQMRSRDILGRYEGNKFAIVLGNCNAEQMEQAARRLLDAAGGLSVLTSGGLLRAGMRMGGVVAGPPGHSVQLLMQQAEEAYHLCDSEVAKRFVAYEPSLVRANERIRSLAATDEIISALNDRRVTLAFQPVVHARSGELAFKEALVRLKRPDGRIIAPDLVMPIAERVGLVQLIDYRVLDLAIDRLLLDPTTQLSINASVNTLHDRDFFPRVAAAVRLHSSVASRLIIEFTETCAITDVAATARLVAALKTLGVRVAMDDFGAGFTSFKYLRDIDIDLLKIDGAFIQNLSRSADDRFIVRTLIELAGNLRIPTVAEWVEDPESAAILTDWGVTYLQGHQFGKADLPEEERHLERLMGDRSAFVG